MQFGILLFLLAPHLSSQVQPFFPPEPGYEFEWKDASGNTHTRWEFNEILGKHQKWIQSGKKSGTQADLAGAKLGGAYLVGQSLSGASLYGADLHGARLDSADLIGANLGGANLAGASLFMADLSGAALNGAVLRARLGRANLSSANLSNADLIGADLTNADLSHALLGSANLTSAGLSGANLSGANLRGANLSGADLFNTKLCGADLAGANLNNAKLLDADVSGANLSDASLGGALMNGAHLGRAVFEPKSLPELRGVAAAKDLESLTFYSNPDALIQLRKQFEDGGFREQERKITYAVKRREAERSCTMCTLKEPPWIAARAFGLPREEAPRAVVWSSDSILANCGSFVLNKMFFDWTCQYGMSPGQPLILGGLIWSVCSLIYFVGIHTHGEGGLYRTYRQSIDEDPSPPRRWKRISRLGAAQSPRLRWLLQSIRHECSLLCTSMFFSLMSAFNIGFRDFNFGRWLRLLTPREFDIKAEGWLRTVAGLQSLISVYLIALWVLTYFGRPFG